MTYPLVGVVISRMNQWLWNTRQEDFAEWLHPETKQW